MSAVRRKKEFGRASPGILTQVRKHANLGHPYGVATTSPAASVLCIFNLPHFDIVMQKNAVGYRLVGVFWRLISDVANIGWIKYNMKP
jgi:hypothetical protein